MNAAAYINTRLRAQKLSRGTTKSVRWMEILRRTFCHMSPICELVCGNFPSTAGINPFSHIASNMVHEHAQMPIQANTMTNANMQMLQHGGGTLKMPRGATTASRILPAAFEHVLVSLTIQSIAVSDTISTSRGSCPGGLRDDSAKVKLASALGSDDQPCQASQQKPSSNATIVRAGRLGQSHPSRRRRRSH